MSNSCPSLEWTGSGYPQELYTIDSNGSTPTLSTQIKKNNVLEQGRYFVKPSADLLSVIRFNDNYQESLSFTQQAEESILPPKPDNLYLKPRLYLRGRCNRSRDNRSLNNQEWRDRLRHVLGVRKFLSKFRRAYGKLIGKNNFSFASLPIDDVGRTCQFFQNDYTPLLDHSYALPSSRQKDMEADEAVHYDFTPTPDHTYAKHHSWEESIHDCNSFLPATTSGPCMLSPVSCFEAAECFKAQPIRDLKYSFPIEEECAQEKPVIFHTNQQNPSDSMPIGTHCKTSAPEIKILCGQNQFLPSPCCVPTVKQDSPFVRKLSDSTFTSCSASSKAITTRKRKCDLSIYRNAELPVLESCSIKWKSDSPTVVYPVNKMKQPTSPPPVRLGDPTFFAVVKDYNRNAKGRPRKQTFERTITEEETMDSSEFSGKSNNLPVDNDTRSPLTELNLLEGSPKSDEEDTSVKSKTVSGTKRRKKQPVKKIKSRKRPSLKASKNENPRSLTRQLEKEILELLEATPNSNIEDENATASMPSIMHSSNFEETDSISRQCFQQIIRDFDDEDDSLSETDGFAHKPPSDSEVERSTKYEQQKLVQLCSSDSPTNKTQRLEIDKSSHTGIESKNSEFISYERLLQMTAEFIFTDSDLISMISSHTTKPKKNRGKNMKSKRKTPVRATTPPAEQPLCSKDISHSRLREMLSEFIFGEENLISPIGMETKSRRKQQIPTSAVMNPVTPEGLSELSSTLSIERIFQEVILRDVDVLSAIRSIGPKTRKPRPQPKTEKPGATGGCFASVTNRSQTHMNWTLNLEEEDDLKTQAHFLQRHDCGTDDSSSCISSGDDDLDIARILDLSSEEIEIDKIHGLLSKSEEIGSNIEVSHDGEMSTESRLINIRERCEQAGRKVWGPTPKRQGFPTFFNGKGIFIGCGVKANGEVAETKKQQLSSCLEVSPDRIEELESEYSADMGRHEDTLILAKRLDGGLGREVSLLPNIPLEIIDNSESLRLLHSLCPMPSFKEEDSKYCGIVNLPNSLDLVKPRSSHRINDPIQIFKIAVYYVEADDFLMNLNSFCFTSSWTIPKCQYEFSEFQTLSELRMILHCEKDCVTTTSYLGTHIRSNIILKHLAFFTNPGWMMIGGGIVYYDSGVPESVELANKFVEYHLSRFNKKLVLCDASITYLRDAKLQYGFPYRIIHQDGCVHNIVVDQSLLHLPGDSLPTSNIFPRISYSSRSKNVEQIMCEVCKKLAMWVVSHANLSDKGSLYACTYCANQIMRHEVLRRNEISWTGAFRIEFDSNEGHIMDRDLKRKRTESTLDAFAEEDYELLTQRYANMERKIPTRRMYIQLPSAQHKLQLFAFVQPALLMTILRKKIKDEANVKKRRK